MSRIVLDASAVLALLNNEHGSKTVELNIHKGLISAVNLSEVISVLGNIGMSQHEAIKLTDDLLPEVISFDKEQAAIAAEMRGITKSFGLSLGDRACLALAKSKKLSVLTADAVWAKLNIGVSVELIR